MVRSSISNQRTRDALAAFLDEHLGAPHRDDVGPMFGQATMVRDAGMVDRSAQRYWHDAVSAALTGGSASKPAKRRQHAASRPPRSTPRAH